MSKHWERSGLARRILEALTAAGKDVDHLTVDDLALTDQFHGGGLNTTLELASLAGLDHPAEVARTVLDVGGGLGGPARVLASRFGCRVTVIDVTQSFVEAARELTGRVGLDGAVTHEVADALNLPFEDGSFDVVWTQNSGMNIADKERLYAGFRRVLRPGGTLAFQEPVAGAVSPPQFPLMWADEPDTSFLLAPGDLHDVVVDCGFEERIWRVVTESATNRSASLPPAHAAQMLIMGPERLSRVMEATRRNVAEERIAVVHGVFTR